jgi:hypothetical protein
MPNLVKKVCFVIILCFCLSCCNRKPNHNTDVILTENKENHVVQENTELNEDTAIREADNTVENLYVINNAIKIAYSDEVHYERNERYSFFKRSNDNNIIFISPTEYLDIKKMAIFSLELPETLKGRKCHYLRPPFSNNKIPLWIHDESYSESYVDELHLYDISNKKFSLMPDVSYSSLFPDSDRHFLTYTMHSPEWWLGIITRRELYFMRKDGTLHRVGKDPDPREYITSEFKGTVFDNEYIMETIRNINNIINNIIAINTDSVVFASYQKSDQKGDNVIIDDSYYSNTFYYFVNRMGIYFDINIKDIFQIKDDDHLLFVDIGIYENGFYIDDKKKLMVLDIKNKKTTLYSFDEELRQYGNKTGFGDYYFITNDGKILLLKVKIENEIIVYKYEL